MRRHRLAALVAGALLLVGCPGAREKGNDTSVPPPATTPDTVQPQANAALATALLGTWTPYGRIGSDEMGVLELTATELRFSKGYQFRYRMAGKILVLDAPTGPEVKRAAALCEGPTARSMTISLDTTDTPAFLRIAVFSVATGPGSNPDLDRGLCARVSYTRR